MVLPEQASGQDLWILSWHKLASVSQVSSLPRKSRELYNTIVLSFIAFCDPAGRCDNKWPSQGRLHDGEPN